MPPARPLAEPESDLIVVGAGPVGLFGAFYAGLREMSVRIVDALEEPGGQVTAMYPEKWIYDVPGFERIKGRDLVAALVAQVERHAPAWSLGERAVGLERVERAGTSWWLLTTSGGAYLAKAVLICAGVGAFKPRKLPQLDVTPWEGRGVCYFVRDLEALRGKRVLIVGGGDSAVDWALNLREIAAAITLIHRRDRFRAHEASAKEVLEDPRIEVRLHHELKAIEGTEHVEAAVVFDNRDGSETRLPVDAIVLALGFQADLGPIREWGLELVGKRRIRVNARMETNLPGVYAAGDVAAVDGVEPLNLIAVGYGQVTVAVNYAYVHVHPEARLFPGHSSER